MCNLRADKNCRGRLNLSELALLQDVEVGVLMKVHAVPTSPSPSLKAYRAPPPLLLLKVDLIPPSILLLPKDPPQMANNLIYRPLDSFEGLLGLLPPPAKVIPLPIHYGLHFPLGESLEFTDQRRGSGEGSSDLGMGESLD